MMFMTVTHPDWSEAVLPSFTPSQLPDSLKKNTQ